MMPSGAAIPRSLRVHLLFPRLFVLPYALNRICYYNESAEFT